uniref:FIIND domain-containing protein n=1 Tax=Gopherus agassizii TaxID=38772 RepID=A0A452HPQ7_9SAUR
GWNQPGLWQPFTSRTSCASRVRLEIINVAITVCGDSKPRCRCLEKNVRCFQPMLFNPFLLALCRFHLLGGGSFLCSETELGFEVRAAVTIEYKYDSWDRHLSTSEKQQWMVAGPLFNIRVEPARAVAAVHLPHFLCLAGGEVDASRMRIAHFVDRRMTLEEPARVRPFHAVLQNPSFSRLGVLWRKIQSKCQAKVHSLALLYRALSAANTTLHLYLIPNDCSLRQVTGNRPHTPRESQSHQST